MFLLICVVIGLMIGYVLGNLIGWFIFGRPDGDPFNWRILGTALLYYRWLDSQAPRGAHVTFDEWLREKGIEP